TGLFSANKIPAIGRLHTRKKSPDSKIHRLTPYQLMKAKDIDNIIFDGHGAPGHQMVGGKKSFEWLDASNAYGFFKDIKMEDGGELYFLGCKVGRGDDGDEFLMRAAAGAARGAEGPVVVGDSAKIRAYGYSEQNRWDSISDGPWKWSKSHWEFRYLGGSLMNGSGGRIPAWGSPAENYKDSPPLMDLDDDYLDNFKPSEDEFTDILLWV
ncbi:hypothetical protein P4C99_22065, partial [Pontiellaceae bacterium B1224]|nr:hypothetical protein [Pontiellaceae bacterium B1224]